MTPDAIDIIKEFYHPKSMLYYILTEHSFRVTEKALSVSARVAGLKPDTAFIEQSAMLHDIGIYLTDAPGIGCTGSHPYLCHGVFGRRLLEKMGLPAHALVCERHIGIGLSRDDILTANMPLPARDMIPVSLEEKIVCYADLFFTKRRDQMNRMKTISEIRLDIHRFGVKKLDRFESWLADFER